MNSSSLSGLPNTFNKYNVGSFSNLQRESREWRCVCVPRHLHIFHRIYIFSGAQSFSYWFPLSSLHFDGGLSDNTVTLRLSAYDYSTEEVQLTQQRCLPSQPSWIGPSWSAFQGSGQVQPIKLNCFQQIRLAVHTNLFCMLMGRLIDVWWTTFYRRQIGLKIPCFY